MLKHELLESLLIDGSVRIDIPSGLCFRTGVDQFLADLIQGQIIVYSDLHDVAHHVPGNLVAAACPLAVFVVDGKPAGSLGLIEDGGVD